MIATSDALLQHLPSQISRSLQSSETKLTQQQWQTEHLEALHRIFIHIVLCLSRAMGLDNVVCLRIIYPPSASELNVSPQLGSSLEYDSQFIEYFCQDQIGLDVRLNFENVLSFTSLNQVRSSPLTFHQKNQICLCLENISKLTLWSHNVHSCRLMRPEIFGFIFQMKYIIGANSV